MCFMCVYVRVFVYDVMVVGGKGAGQMVSAKIDLSRTLRQINMYLIHVPVSLSHGANDT
jgi:hypothetical protein